MARTVFDENTVQSEELTIEQRVEAESKEEARDKAVQVYFDSVFAPLEDVTMIVKRVAPKGV